MPRITFLLSCRKAEKHDVSASVISVSAQSGEKVLAAGLREEVPIRFGCAACRCGLCAVEVVDGNLLKICDDEKRLLKRLRILDGEKVRLSCRACVVDTDVKIDLRFQENYEPAAQYEEVDKVLYSQRKTG